jgi:nucleotide-binding universal stress UspA family protein
MFKSLLVPLLGENCDQAVLETAWLFAREFDAHLDCLHVRPNALEMAVRLSAVDAATAAPVTAELWKSLENEAAARAKSARACFDHVTAERSIVQAAQPPHAQGVSGAYRENEGNFLRAVICEARTRDLVVLGRCEPALDAGALGGVLVSSGRPLLLVPKKAPQALFETVAIAWKDTAEAARALALAMPVLMKAGRVVVLAAAEGGASAEDVQASAARALEYLHWHGLACETQCVPAVRGALHAVMEAAAKASAKLLVMGGYGHSRLREFVFGGFTSSVLDGAHLAIFMAH